MLIIVSTKKVKLRDILEIILCKINKRLPMLIMNKILIKSLSIIQVRGHLWEAALGLVITLTTAALQENQIRELTGQHGRNTSTTWGMLSRLRRVWLKESCQYWNNRAKGRRNTIKAPLIGWASQDGRKNLLNSMDSLYRLMDSQPNFSEE